ncbi:Hypothetical predicted protein [Pelobates cultripes]|uniref:Uncharacterized protein n=1 Tax=Pelobates cultripes TaxID=61616 RepID=A0AAD1RZS0_PELCU|nr:Hypothetical predicted protein [Pelobates cultripes]
MVAELCAVVREEIQGVRRDLENRVKEVEAESQHAALRQQEAEVATTRQGSMNLELRRQVEDIDNRGRRINVRIRGLPEESLQEVLTGLFTQLLGEEGQRLPTLN